MADAPENDRSEEFTERSSEFLEWFHGFPTTRLNPKVQLVDLRSRGAGRGAVAAADIDLDEELFAVPRSIVLTATTSSIPPDILQPLKDTGSWLPLIVSIVYEFLKRESSSWYPYFRVLPTTFDALMFWTESELKELQASAVVNKIGKADAEDSWKDTIIPIMLQHPDLFPLMEDDEAAKIRALIRLAHLAGSLIMAYAFDIDRDDQQTPSGGEGSDGEDLKEDDEDEPLKGMVPMADMLNADADRNNARLFQEDDYLVMKATKPINAGDEIFNDYGPLPRSDLLRMYGYTTDHYAQYDVVELEHHLFLNVVGVQEAKKNKAWLKREEQLEEIGIIDDGYSLQRPPTGARLDEYLPGNVHMLLRGFCLDDGTTKITKMNYQESISIEEATLLSTVVTKKLSEYGSPLRDDQLLCQTMQSAPSDHTVADTTARRFQMAVQVRTGEKEILHDLIEMCQAHITQKTNEIANPARKRKHEDKENTTSKQKAAKRRT